MKSKKCTKCKKELEINRDNFYVKTHDWINGKSSFVFLARCKVCTRKTQMVRDRANAAYRKKDCEEYYEDYSHQAYH